ncbi:N-acetyl-gamma-glutamyl-phosphate reductase [Desulfovibrio litoralis]|uniref:N-acetyl-gamma-glutamyl-phosphate reductase n=1 Tax=Desulfovibrio litoralis DSM 11393 TaxID=1121455 RepID=A0A1M7RTA0_9BACT|nr:N-acetyl-gamma-glutamyl-phosphate reductase [Desulfovibrio litoralis]SHN49414.1 N-acetyl-gamma-glutamyl-phosphate reductase [Desulfovibrio litoralis DSM 11393]
MKKQIKVGLVGVTGYTGMELARLCLAHPNFTLTAATSRAEAGKKLSEIYPFLQKTKLQDLIISEPNPKELAKTCELVFLAVPHGAAMNVAAELLDQGLKVVDLSADFRLRDVSTFESWYNTPHAQQSWLKKAVYGLPELYAEEIAKAQLIANPGCYPTASILALYPALKNKLIKDQGIIIDAKSGTSGAGRKATVGTLFCEVSDSFRAYNIGGKHRHTPEIEQELSLANNSQITLSFNPHLLPLNRGILNTIYTELNTKSSAKELHEVYSKFYEKHSFVRVLPLGSLPELRFVRGTMFCDLALTVDERTKRLILVSCIDNLCRGASGQAIANANLMLGLELETGLNLAPLVP